MFARTFSALTFGCLGAIASANITSDFQDGADGWMGVNVSFPGLEVLNTVSPTWTGNSITVTESGSGLFVLAAPTKFLGNQSSYLGGTVSFQLASATSDGVSYPNLLLRGNGRILYHETPAPNSSLTFYEFSLAASGWKNELGQVATQSEMENVLSNLDVFAVNADWTTGGTDEVELDNVVMAAPVPEPATLISLGVGAFMLRRRRRQRS